MKEFSLACTVTRNVMEHFESTLVKLTLHQSEREGERGIEDRGIEEGERESVVIMMRCKYGNGLSQVDRVGCRRCQVTYSGLERNSEEVRSGPL